jgi:hypothetical protein
LSRTFFVAYVCILSGVGSGYFESEVETDAAILELETSVAALELEMNAVALELERDAGALDLEMETDVPQERSK